MVDDTGVTASVLIPTRDRPAALAALLESLRSSGHLDRPEVQILVIDNNVPGSACAHKVADLAARFSVPRIVGPGPKSTSINTVAMQALGQHLVFVDDDCSVPDRDWLSELLGPLSDAGVGYVSGLVLAGGATSDAQRMWEAKGGLSKGSRPLSMAPPRRRHTANAWRLKTVAAGANCTIPRTIFLEIGGFCERLGPGTPVQAGETLEIVDRVLRAGYTARYTPKSRVHHVHPSSPRELRSKLRSYARGDTAMAVEIAISRGDCLAALWALGGHQLYRARNTLLAVLRRYPLSVRYTLASLMGSVEGLYLYVRAARSGPRRHTRTRVPSASPA